MIRRHGLLILVVVLAALALPAGAFAVPPDNDSYNSPHLIFNSGANSLANEFFDSTTDTTDATAGEQGEFLNCLMPASGTTASFESWMDHTAWWEFTPPTDGEISVTATGITFDPVIRVVPFTPAEFLYGDPSHACHDYNEPSPTEDLVHYIKAGHSYNIQVGSFAYTEGNTPQSGTGGLIQLRVRFARDSDSDGVLDRSDGCPTQPGPASNNGCAVVPPPSNRDGDALVDSRDNCPTIKGSIANGGCPAAGGSPFLTAALVPGGLRFTSLLIKGVPRGATVELRCKRGGRKVCSTRRVKAKTTSVRFKRGLSGKRFRAGTKFEVRITKASTIGRYLAYTVRNGRAPSKTSRCMNRGSTKPAPKGAQCR